jgi:putative ABC transport system substrate-binding protein
LHARRRFLWTLATACLLLPSGAFGQQHSKLWRIGFLSPRRRPVSLAADYYGAFPQRMSELGYVEGKNLVIEYRFAEGDYQRLPSMAADLVRAKVDVILALGPPGALAAQKATTTIPIVFVVSGDPVAIGLVKSLANPGGNITGLSNLALDLSAKHLELLVTMVPKLSRVAILINPANSAHEMALANLEALAQKSGIGILPVKAQTPVQIESAFSRMAAERAGATIVALDPLFIQQGPQIAELALKHRLASIFANREYAEAGGLISYGQNQVEIYQRAARYVDRIFKGARAGDLPVEQPTKLELCINARTAKILGLTIPHSLRLIADEVIE